MMLVIVACVLDVEVVEDNVVVGVTDDAEVVVPVPVVDVVEVVGCCVVGASVIGRVRTMRVVGALGDGSCVVLEGGTTRVVRVVWVSDVVAVISMGDVKVYGVWLLWLSLLLQSTFWHALLGLIIRIDSDAPFKCQEGNA